MLRETALPPSTAFPPPARPAPPVIATDSFTSMPFSTTFAPIVAVRVSEESALNVTAPAKSPSKVIVEFAAQAVAVEALPTISASMSKLLVFQRLFVES